MTQSATVILVLAFLTFTLNQSLGQKTCSKLGSVPGLNIGRRLVGSTYTAVNAFKIKDCVTSCLRQKRCLSFNYQSATQQCELTDSNVTLSDAVNLLNATGWSHVCLSDWPRTLAGMCEANPCGRNAICKTNSTGYYCERVELCIDLTSPRYHGSVNVTKSGKTCQRWDQQVPHRPSVYPDGLSTGDPVVSQHHNYCRPVGQNIPWCYTMDSDKRLEDCYVPTC